MNAWIVGLTEKLHATVVTPIKGRFILQGTDFCWLGRNEQGEVCGHGFRGWPGEAKISEVGLRG